MVKNNIELDVKVKCIENGTTQAQIAEDILVLCQDLVQVKMRNFYPF